MSRAQFPQKNLLHFHSALKAQKSGIFDKTKHKGGPITEDKKRTYVT